MSNLNVLALGDSIVWGQGNTADTKLVGLVCGALRARGHVPTLTMLAHSGANAAATGNDAAPALWGEVPEAAPSILAQIPSAAAQLAPATVDVLIINGGANDVSPYHVVVANPFNPNGLADLDAHCRQVFTGPVKTVIDLAVATYPNAKIVVTGYYPIVSAQTNVRALVQLMKHLPRPANVANALDLTIEHLPDVALALAIQTERSRIVEQSALFATLSAQLLRTIVQWHAGTGRVFFADPGFGPQNAFSAPQTWLWSGSDDPLFPERAEKYTEHLRVNPFDWPFVTPLASMCHPNTLGSKAYADAVVACLVQAGL